MSRYCKRCASADFVDVMMRIVDGHVADLANKDSQFSREMTEIAVAVELEAHHKAVSVAKRWWFPFSIRRV